MIQFAKPLYLLLLIPALYSAYVLSRRSLADLSLGRARLALALRVSIIVMLIFTLAGARMVRSVSHQSVVFLIDISDSIPDASRKASLDYVNQALKGMKHGQTVGVVAFGGDATVELSPSSVKRIDKIYSVANSNQTDISQALGLALAIFPEESAKKIVLISDGNETMGKAMEQAMLASSNNVSVDVVPINNELPHEVLIDDIICPGGAKIGEPFDLKVIAMAREPGTAYIRLIRDGATVAEKQLDMINGKSAVSFRQSIDKAGSHEYKAILEAKSDTRAENNIAVASMMVHGKPRVLYIEGETSQSRYLAQALQGGDMQVEVKGASGIPATLSDLNGYDAIILSDIPAWNMSADQMAMIKSGVRDLGVGLTMVGGENSFGAGGYFDTPIEEALPVDMSIRKKKVMPSLSAIVVMDKSGSMSAPEGGVEKIRLANDGAAAVVKLLQPIDKVGVIVCHDFPVAAVPLKFAKNKGPIYQQISTIRAEGGGIDVYESMKMANAMISGSNTRQRHIILLADGSDCDNQNGVVPMVQEMAKKKITVTTVAIGDGPHVPFLKTVAYYGKGDFYLAKFARDLKAIFTKDIMTVSKSLVIEEPFIPKMDTSSPELGGISPSGVPPLLGYIAVSPKSAAVVPMASHRNDPVLATWQYGLGRSAAFTSDCKARWSARWLGWPGYGKLWTQTIRSTMRSTASTDFQTAIDVESGAGHVAIDAVDPNGNFLNMLKFKGSVVGPDMKSHPLSVEQTGPGRYESTFDARRIGSYVVSILRTDQKKSAPDVSIINIPYSPEYKGIGPNTALLKQIAADTSGKFAPSAEEIFKGNFRKSRAYTDLWRLLIILALLLLPVDIAVRRLMVDMEQIATITTAAREYLRGRIRTTKAKQPEKEETVNTLLNIKREQSSTATKKPDIQPIDLGNVAVPTPPTPERAKAKEQPKETPKPSAPEEDLTSRLLDAKRRAREKK